MFFSLSSWALALILVAVIVGTTVAGLVAGGQLRKRGDTLREPFGVLQTATLGIVALLLAFGLSLAIGRYETRRAAVVDDANTIGTTYLRAQTLAEPVRTRSLDLLRRYADEAIRISHEVPGSAEMRRTEAAQEVLQRRLWSLAGQALDDAPVASAPRLYVDSLEPPRASRRRFAGRGRIASSCTGPPNGWWSSRPMRSRPGSAPSSST